MTLYGRRVRRHRHGKAEPSPNVKADLLRHLRTDHGHELSESWTRKGLHLVHRNAHERMER